MKMTKSLITIDKHKYNHGWWKNKRNKWKGMESNKKHLWSKNENLSTDNTSEIAVERKRMRKILLLFVYTIES